MVVAQSIGLIYQGLNQRDRRKSEREKNCSQS